MLLAIPPHVALLGSPPCLVLSITPPYPVPPVVLTLLSPSAPPSMGNRHHIPDAIKQHIFTQSTFNQQSTIADRFRVSTRTVHRIVKNFRNYGVVYSPKPPTVRQPRKLLWGDIIVRQPSPVAQILPSLIMIQYLMSLIQHTPDIRLSELQQLLKIQQGASVTVATIWRSLCGAGYSMKKVSISALEQNEDACCQYLLTVRLGFSAKQLVFVDKFACNQITVHWLYAWLPISNHAKRHDYFIFGKR